LKNDATYIGIDFGGTNIKAIGITSEGGTLCEKNVPANAEKGPEQVIEKIVSLINEVVDDCPVPREQFNAVGVAAAGIVDMERGICRFLPNLPGWVNIHLVEKLLRKIDLQTFLINDVRAMTLAEWTLGAGVGVKNLICIAVGTGIGGGIVLDGKLYFGSEGLAGEIGHQTIEPDGPRCTCGNHGCLEALASGANIAFQAIRIVKQGATTIIRDLVENDLNRITPMVVAEAARSGDQMALDIWEREAYYLGMGLANLVVIFNPEMIILGGGIAEASDLLIEGVQETLRDRVLLGHDLKRLRIVPCKLKNLSGAIGAAAWAQIKAENSR
jgi:glucokinase